LSQAQQASYLFRAALGVVLGAVTGAIAGLIWDMGGSSRLYLFMSPAGAVAGGLLTSVFPRARWLLDSATLDR
jgi:hypothetical protein